ncbi:unnamed protein product [Ascophyllum nodosum]
MSGSEAEGKKGTKRPRSTDALTSMEATEDREQPSAGKKAANKSAGNRVPQSFTTITPLPRQHPRHFNKDLPGCIVRQDFHCAVLPDVLGQEGVEQCLSFHPNGLSVVQLAPTHPAASGGERIVAVDFDAGGCNIQQSEIVKGKKKKGAMQLQSSTVLCSITTNSGKQYKVCTGIGGELMQANRALLDDPGLLSEDPLGRGWLAIVRLKPRDLRRLQDALGVSDDR